MGGQLKKGFIYTAIGTYSTYVFQLVVTMILSRLLTPREYGVVAIMQVFILFFQIVIEGGMGAAIIQDKTLTTDEIGTIFNYSFCASLVMALLFGLSGRLFVMVYGNPIYTGLVWLQAVSILFNGLNIVPTALLNKALRFRMVNASVILSNLVAGAVGVITAFKGFGVYALILSSIASAVVNFGINLSCAHLRVVKSLSFDSIKKVGKFSLHVLGGNVLNFFTRNLDNLLIGKMMSPTALAYYNKAYNLVRLPNSLFAGIFNPVLQPVLSSRQDDVAYIKQVFFRIIRLLALVSVPLTAFLVLSAREIIFVLYGDQWGEAVIPFAIIASSCFLQVTVNPISGIVIARGLARLNFRLGVLSAVFLIGSIVIGVALGSIISVAICFTIGMVVNCLVVVSLVVVRALEGSVLEFFKLYVSPLVVGGMVAVGLAAVDLVEIPNLYVMFALKLIVALGIFTVYVLLTPEKKFIAQLVKQSA